MKEIYTRRLKIRDLSLIDLDDFYEYAKIPEVGKNAGFEPHESIFHSEFILNDLILSKDTFAIELLHNKKMIGTISIYDDIKKEKFLEENEISIGYSLSSSYWNQGFATEAAIAILKDYLNNHPSIKAIKVMSFDNNFRSKRVIEKLGFHKYDMTIINEIETNHYKITVNDFKEKHSNKEI